MSAASPFSPVRVGPLTLRNRFIKSATNEGMAKGGMPSRLLVEHHRRMAAGGAAMTTVAYCAISPDGRTFEDQVTLDEASLPHLRALTDAVHREGGAACAQRAGAWARAVDGAMPRTAAIPADVVMNSRRLMESPMRSPITTP